MMAFAVISVYTKQGQDIWVNISILSFIFFSYSYSLSLHMGFSWQAKQTIIFKTKAYEHF
jgi:hypothetical protein